MFNTELKMNVFVKISKGQKTVGFYLDEQYNSVLKIVSEICSKNLI